MNSHNYIPINMILKGHQFEGFVYQKLFMTKSVCALKEVWKIYLTEPGLPLLDGVEPNLFGRYSLTFLYILLAWGTVMFVNIFLFTSPLILTHFSQK